MAAEIVNVRKKTVIAYHAVRGHGDGLYIVKCMIQVVTNSHKYSSKAIHWCLPIFFQSKGKEWSIRHEVISVFLPADAKHWTGPLASTGSNVVFSRQRTA